jgi:hypothetical protein
VAAPVDVVPPVEDEEVYLDDRALRMPSLLRETPRTSRSATAPLSIFLRGGCLLPCAGLFTVGNRHGQRVTRMTVRALCFAGYGAVWPDEAPVGKAPEPP